MKSFTTSIMKFIKDEEGATALEYAMFVALISVAILAGLGQNIQGDLTNIFAQIATQISQAANPPAPAP